MDFGHLVFLVVLVTSKSVLSPDFSGMPWALQRGERWILDLDFWIFGCFWSQVKVFWFQWQAWSIGTRCAPNSGFWILNFWPPFFFWVVFGLLFFLVVFCHLFFWGYFWSQAKVLWFQWQAWSIATKWAPNFFVPSRCVSNSPGRQTSGGFKHYIALLICWQTVFRTCFLISSYVTFLPLRKSTIPEYKREYEEIEIRW